MTPIKDELFYLLLSRLQHCLKGNWLNNDTLVLRSWDYDLNLLKQGSQQISQTDAEQSILVIFDACKKQPE